MHPCSWAHKNDFISSPNGFLLSVVFLAGVTATWIPKFLVCLEEPVSTISWSRVPCNCPWYARLQYLLQAHRCSKLWPQTGAVRCCVHHWPLWSWQESDSGQCSYYVSIRFLFIGFQGLWESYLLTILLSSFSCYITLQLSTVFEYFDVFSASRSKSIIATSISGSL